MLLLRALTLTLALSGLAFPAWAQDGMPNCHLDTPRFDHKGWIGGAKDAWDLATADTYLDMSLQIPADGYNAFAFSVSSGINARLEVASRNSDLAPLATISPSVDELGVAGVLDDGRRTGGFDEFWLPAGDYCLLVNSKWDHAADIVLRLGREEHAPLTIVVPDEMRDLSVCERAPLFGEVGTTRMVTANEAPVWRFELTREARLTIIADSNEAQPDIDLKDINDVQVWSGDQQRFDGYVRIVPGFSVDPGTYCVFMNAENKDVPFPLSVSIYDPAEAAANEYNLGREAPPLDSGHPMETFGRISGDGAEMAATLGRHVSWFVFTHDESAAVTIRANAPSAPDAEIPLVLFSMDGTKVSWGQDYLDTYLEEVTEYDGRLRPGTYRLGVAHFLIGQELDVEIAIERR